MVKACLKLVKEKRLLDNMNDMTLVLIPKKSNAKQMSDLKPILL